MNSDEYATIMDQTGSKLEELATKERWRAMQQWREVFAAPCHAVTGKWKYGDYDWHAFTWGRTKCVNRHHAMRLYEQQVAERYYVMPEDEFYPAYLCVGGSLPKLRSLVEDIHVWPADLSWTMAFTHEMDSELGPFFCMREWIDDA